MRSVKLIPQNRTGLFPEHNGVAPIKYECRATIPAVEALRAAGATVEPLAPPSVGYTITLGAKMPTGIVAVHVGHGIGLRMGNEPAFPVEHEDYWAQVSFTPCPKCGAPVVWYEAGYVTGYRVCSQPPHHHSIAK